MKIVERFACVDCEKDLTTAGLVHKRVPNTEGSCRCDFCKQRRYCTQYLIQYGRKGKSPGRCDERPGSPVEV